MKNYENGNGSGKDTKNEETKKEVVKEKEVVKDSSGFDAFEFDSSTGVTHEGGKNGPESGTGTGAIWPAVTSPPATPVKIKVDHPISAGKRGIINDY